MFSPNTNIVIYIYIKKTHCDIKQKCDINITLQTLHITSFCYLTCKRVNTLKKKEDYPK